VSVQNEPMREKIERQIERAEDGCWLWTGAVSRTGRSAGYAYVSVGRQASRVAHRVAYQVYVGPISDGMQVDHECHNRDLTCPGGVTCRHRRCVNPEHLVARTQSENIQGSNRQARIPACRNGHPFTAENTAVLTTGRRRCRTCRREQEARPGQREAKRIRNAKRSEAPTPPPIASSPVGGEQHG
jgi:hypothetical protein